jgi:hypothetical protein
MTEHDPRSTFVRHVSPEPLRHHGDTVSKADKEHDVNEEPDKPLSPSGSCWGPNCAVLALYVDFLKSSERPFIVPISPSRHRANLAAVLVAEEVASEGRFPSSYPYAAITASIGTPKSTGQRCV